MVVFFVPQNGAGAVDLLSEDETDELVGKGKDGERPGKAGTPDDPLIKAEGSADKEDKVAGAFGSPLLQEGGERYGGKLLAVLVQRYKKIIGFDELQQQVPLLFLQLRFGQCAGVFWRGNDIPLHREIASYPPRKIIRTFFDVGFMRLAHGPERDLHYCKLSWFEVSPKS